MPPIPNPITVVANFLSSLANYVNQRRLGQSLSDLTASVDAINDTLGRSITGMQFVFDQVHGAYMGCFALAEQIGGAVRVIGLNQQYLWHKLRWELMPNTIQYIWDFVYWAWIGPLRRHIHIFAWSQWTYNGWTSYNIGGLSAWTRALEAIGRSYRARWVYPQIANLLYPPRVAYWYCRDILTEISLYLTYDGHHETRDAVTRVVWSNGPRLWQYMSDAIARWLETEVGAGGFGSELPQRGAGATYPMPPAAGDWEPWLGEYQPTTIPAQIPDIPETNWSYDQ